MEDGNEFTSDSENFQPNMDYGNDGRYSGKLEPAIDDYPPTDDLLAEEDVQLPGVDDLPLFANAEAKKVDADIKEKEIKIEEVHEKIADMSDRLKVMKEHFKNVQQELDHTNALFNAKTSEIQTERHLRQLTSRALGRGQSESKKLQAELEAVQARLNLVQNDIYKANEKMDEFKMQMNWNQEELERWAVAAKQKEEDNLALQKYTRADEIKIKELNLQLEQLTKNHQQERTMLDDEISDTQAKQMELDRVAIEFKKVHQERHALVQRWQETIEEMKRRDIEINSLGERFAIAKAERVKKEAVVKAQQKRLQVQQNENRDVESRSEMLSRVVSRKRDEMMTGSQKLVELRSELESLKNELTTAAESLVAKRAQNTNKAQMNEEKRIQLERERQRYQVVKANLETAQNSTMKAEELARKAEKDLQDAEQELENQHTRVKLLKDKLFKETQGVHDLKNEELRLRTDISGTKTICRNYDNMLTQLDKEAARQQELLYNAEFQIQQIERKVARGMGERSDEEKRQLKQQITDLEGQLDQVKEKRKMLQTQGRKLQNELAMSRLLRDEQTTQKGKLVERQGELELANRMIEDDYKAETKVKEEMSVQNDLLRLEVRRLRDLLSAKADSVFSLENRRQQLLMSMEERKQEINVHREVLKAEFRTLNDEKHKVTMELRGKEAAVDKLRARFEATSKGSEEEGEGKSQSYYIILAAQRREQLQRQGDELDHAVRKAEREIRALQTTLDHLNARNTAYRASFQKVDLKGDDAEVLKQLEERAKMGKDILFRQKKELQRLTTDFEEDSRRLQQVKSQSVRVVQQKEHLESARRQVCDEILTQQAQLEELKERSDRIINKHRDKVADSMAISVDQLKGGTLEEKMALSEVYKEVVQNVLYTLGQLSSEFPEVSDLLSKRLQEADIKVPPKPPTRGGGGASRTGTVNQYGTANTTYGGRPGTGGSDVLSARSTPRNPYQSAGQAVQPREFEMDF